MREESRAALAHGDGDYFTLNHRVRKARVVRVGDADPVSHELDPEVRGLQDIELLEEGREAAMVNAAARLSTRHSHACSCFAEAISPLAALDDEALWRAARDRLPADAAERLESLGQKRQREGLTEPERQEAATLIRQYERAMLVRAHAAALLKQRGHDVSILLTAA